VKWLSPPLSARRPEHRLVPSSLHPRQQARSANQSINHLFQAGSVIKTAKYLKYHDFNDEYSC